MTAKKAPATRAKVAKTAARTSAPKPTPVCDVLADIKVDVFAALGDTSFKVECTLGVAADVGAEMHAELERMVKLHPRLKPHADGVPSGAIYVDDGDDGYRLKRLGFC